MQKINLFQDVEWRTIPNGFSNYEVSNYGLVRNAKTKKTMKPRLDKGGYLDICLVSDNGERKRVFVHRLVAMAFLVNDDPLNKTHINHLNECKTDNRLVNLVYCSPKENANHGTRNKRASETRKKIKSLGEYKVVQIKCDNSEVIIHDSIKAASLYNNVNEQRIKNCCHGLMEKTANSFFQYVASSSLENKEINSIEDLF